MSSRLAVRGSPIEAVGAAGVAAAAESTGGSAWFGAGVITAVQIAIGVRDGRSKPEILPFIDGVTGGWPGDGGLSVDVVDAYRDHQCRGFHVAVAVFGGEGKLVILRTVGVTGFAGEAVFAGGAAGRLGTETGATADGEALNRTFVVGSRNRERDRAAFVDSFGRSTRRHRDVRSSTLCQCHSELGLSVLFGVSVVSDGEKDTSGGAFVGGFGRPAVSPGMRGVAAGRGRGGSGLCRSDLKSDSSVGIGGRDLGTGS